MSKTKDEVTTTGRAVFYTVLWESFRKAALECGWSLALHGSMARDMDMMAMKWTEDAKSKEDLVEALNSCIDGTFWKEYNFKPFYGKPNDRVVYTLRIFSDFYIDLSIVEKPKLKVAYVRDLLDQLQKEEITFSRMVELLNNPVKQD